jgi:hypothetical protein
MEPEEPGNNVGLAFFCEGDWGIPLRGGWPVELCALIPDEYGAAVIIICGLCEETTGGWEMLLTAAWGELVGREVGNEESLEPWGCGRDAEPWSWGLRQMPWR